MNRVKRRAIAAVSILLFASSAGIPAEASATTLLAPSVTVSGQGTVGTSGSPSGICLNKFSPPGSDGAMFVFTNYQKGTEIRFRLFDSAGNQVTQVLDYVGANPGLGLASQCVNLVASPGAWFSVTVPAGLMQIELIGIPNSFSNSGTGVGYFQSIYVSGATSSAVTVTPISFPTSTTTPSTTTTLSPPVATGSIGPGATFVQPSTCEPGSVTISRTAHAPHISRSGNTVQVNFLATPVDGTFGVNGYRVQLYSSNPGDGPQAISIDPCQADSIFVGSEYRLTNSDYVCSSVCSTKIFDLTFPNVQGDANDAVITGYRNGVVAFEFSAYFPQYSSYDQWSCVVASHLEELSSETFLATKVALDIVGLAGGGIPALLGNLIIDNVALAAGVNPATGTMEESSSNTITLVPGITSSDISHMAPDVVKEVLKEYEDVNHVSVKLASYKFVSADGSLNELEITLDGSLIPAEKLITIQIAQDVAGKVALVWSAVTTWQSAYSFIAPIVDNPGKLLQGEESC